jgi:hypothetical protein
MGAKLGEGRVGLGQVRSGVCVNVLNAQDSISALSLSLALVLAGFIPSL